MEIRAAWEAVRSLPGPLVVVTDSTYVANCFRDRWWETWVANGWRNKARKDVANRDLWEPLVEAVRADPHRVRWQWVKGHSGDPANDLVDRLAVEAAREQAGRAGTGPPVALGPPDRPGRAAASTAPAVTATDARVPPGHRLVVGGLRPPALGGYGANPVADGVRARLVEILAAQWQLAPDLVVMTGLGLGAEQLGAEAAAAAGIPYAAVLAFPGQETTWPPASRQRHAALLAGARSQVVLQTARPSSRQQAAAALARRDAWLARHAHQALVVWDHEDAAVGRQVRSLGDHLGEEEVWIVEPGRPPSAPGSG